MKWMLCLLLLSQVAVAAPWPGEPWRQSQVLTTLDNDFAKNVSGAHYNPETRTFWVAVNAPGKFLAIVEDGAGWFKIDQRNGARGEWSPGGDLEGITQVDYQEQAVYLLAEGEDIIRKYDTSAYGAVKLLQQWNFHAHVPTMGAVGSEGITFVPDTWLTSKGFVDKAGKPYTSKNGMGGLMLIAHQNGGGVYAFDLSASSSAVTFVGSYKTSRTESCGLEFDRSNGRLYVWHNLGINYLEVVDLASTALPDGTRQLKTLMEFDGPKSGNLEGFALAPAASGEHVAFLVDDDNQDGAALMRFRNFQPDLKKVDVRISASADDAEESVSGATSLASTDLELTQETTTQVVGMRFPMVQIPPKARILRAYLQFAVDETVNLPPALIFRGQAAPNALSFAAQPKNVSSRLSTQASVAWAPPEWTVVGEAGEKQRTADLSPILTELVALPGWTTSSPVVLLVTGTGRRVAESWDGDQAKAPLLHVEWEP